MKQNIHIFLFYICYYMFIKDEVINVYLVECMDEDSLLLLRCASCLFSFASLCFLASIFAYSDASCFAFKLRWRFCAITCLLRCNLCGVTRRWILGAFVFGLAGSGLPSLVGMGRLMMN